MILPPLEDDPRFALALLETASAPNTIVASAYRWRQTRERAAW